MIKRINKNVFVLTIHKTFIISPSSVFLKQYEEDAILCQVDFFPSPLPAGRQGGGCALHHSGYRTEP
jgi:hypothetical protein